jgi:hypothetical protein
MRNRTLRRLDLAIGVRGGLIVLRSPGEKPDGVLSALVWPIRGKIRIEGARLGP